MQSNFSLEQLSCVHVCGILMTVFILYELYSTVYVGYVHRSMKVFIFEVCTMCSFLFQV